MKTEKSRWGGLCAAWILAAATLLAFAADGIVVAQTAAVAPGDESGRADCKRTACDQREVSRNVAGQQVFVDPATGRLRQPTPEESQRLAEGLRQMLSQSAEGLEVIQLQDGTMMVDLQDRFQDVAMATVGDDGQVTMMCVHDAASAQALLEGGSAPRPGPGDRGTRKEAVKKAASKPAPSKAEEE